MQRRCEAFEQSGTLNRYVTGKATRVERRAFEDHYLECSDCFDALMVASGVISQLPKRNSRRHAHPRRTLYGVIGGIGIAAAISGVLVTRSMSFRRIEALGALERAPEYGGVAVRSAESSADEHFDAGMTRYAAANYGEAATHLRAALDAGIDPLPAEFFFGICMLLLDEPAAAVTSFNQVIALGDSPYRTEAHYYVAKSLLRLRQSDEALRHLQAIANEQAPVAARARALADSIQR